jgi:tRNA A-37 threonylcarbamoyl transferase component Bud32
MSHAPVDIPALLERMRVIAKTYDPSVPFELREDLKTIFNNFERFISSMLQTAISTQASFWKMGGIRMADSRTVIACLKSLEAQTKPLGSGFFGSVFDVPVSRCISDITKHIPSGVKRVGIKIEALKQSSENQSPSRVHEVFEIAKKAAKLAIGPAIYDVFVTLWDDGTVRIVKIFEIVRGTSWESTQWTSTKAKAKAARQLDAHIHTMNKAGILHHDLHSGNVMVSKTGRVYIIDFDLATFSKDEEASTMYRFNDSYSLSKGVLSEEGVAFVFQALMDEGSLRLKEEPLPTATQVPQNKTVKGKKKSSKKTRRA